MPKLVPSTKVLNRIANDEAYKSSYPAMKGNGHPATQELHVFLAEIDPSQKRVKQYYKAVKDWNEQHSELTDKMKACYLALIFRDSKGNEKTVKVMQSARYFRCDNTDEVVKEAHKDADYFVKRGFSVIREKIEAMAYGIEGIPQTDAETQSYQTKYFEFHIKIGRNDAKDKRQLDKKEIKALKSISSQFTSQFKKPVPLSYNCNQDGVSGDGLGHQRFLNVRFRNQGITSIKPKLETINKAISDIGLRVIKTISEYVWYDSYTALDHGWIDYSPEELEDLLNSNK